MKEADVALAPLPQADGQIKARPVVRSAPDAAICGLACLRRQHSGSDETIEPAHTDFASSGRKAVSLIRLGFLTVLPGVDSWASSVPSRGSAIVVSFRIFVGTWIQNEIAQPEDGGNGE